MRTIFRYTHCTSSEGQSTPQVSVESHQDIGSLYKPEVADMHDAYPTIPASFSAEARKPAGSANQRDID